MNRALLYLTLCSFKNRMRVRLQRLRNPRYALGLLFGIGYFYLFFFRRHAGSSGLLQLLSRVEEPVELAAAFLLFLFAALIWVWPTQSRPALAFTRADVQFLFTAPITRPQLVRYKIVRSQLGALFASALFTLFFRPASLSGGWIFLLGISLILAILNLHLTGVSLSRESLGTHGAAGIARQWLPVTIVAAAVLVLAGTVAADWGTLSSLSAGGVLKELQRLATTGAARVVLWPFRALTCLPLAPSPAAFARALPAVLTILGLNYFWVMRSDAAFEEASAEAAEKRAHRRQVRRSPASASAALPTPFALAPQGRPEVAIAWKNLLLLGRNISPRTLGRVLILLLLVFLVVSRSGAGEGIVSIIAPACLVLAAGTAIMGPQMMRNDLRQDLAQLDVLKSWPVRGASVIRGEVLAPAAVLSVVVWVLLAGAAIVSSRISFLKSLPPLTRASYTVIAMLVTPGVILAQLLVHNGLAVLFPAWVAVGDSRARGVDVMGQRMLMMAGMLLAVVLAVLPAVLVGGAVALLYHLLTQRVVVFVPAVIAATILLAEAFLGSEILGRLLDRTDPTAVEVEE
jgi:ABC-2 type transport system permease protein